MAANVGRTIHVYWGDETPQPLVAGVEEKGLTLNGEAVDITNDDDAGWRGLLDAAQTNSVDISVSGVLVDDTLRKDWFDGADATGARMQAATFIYPDGAQIAGTFYMQGYTETGAKDDKVTFECNFMSSGPVTYTPAA